MTLFKALSRVDNAVHLTMFLGRFRPMSVLRVVVSENVVLSIGKVRFNGYLSCCSSIKFLLVMLFLHHCYSSLQIAQVHRATLSDGQEVVVKVQHEGIKTIILEVFHIFPFQILECK